MGGFFGATENERLAMKFALLFVGVASALARESYVGGLSVCSDSEAFCLEKPSMYIGDMPTSHPAAIDTFAALTKPPTVPQTVLPMIRGGNSNHDTTTWKCDMNPSIVPGLTAELVYGYVAAGNSLPYCIPLPVAASDSSASTWMQLGYALKKAEQAMWAAYYTEVPGMAAMFAAGDAFFGWSL